ncbi:MAG: glutathionylspermidine synthase family protein [Oceanospirillaceae bacterium]
MFRSIIKERPHWRESASEYGFNFHTMHGEAYWDESAYYQFSLQQIERDIEGPTQELHQMCLEVVNNVVSNEQLLKKFQIPETHWDFIRNSWLAKESSLYARIDLAYGGSGPAKLYENNADTPTSLYETGFWQWLWLQDQVNSGQLSRKADQFNSLQDKLITRFSQLRLEHPAQTLYFSCCKDTDEDRGTVQYLEDCASAAGIECKFIYIEDIGLSADDCFTDLNNLKISWMFKLYPWEFMLREEYASTLIENNTSWLEPPWKALLSNKALLPMLWKMFENHPNLLPSFFEDELANSQLKNYVKKPIFAREGANISINIDGKETYSSPGPYGDEGYIYQAYYPLPAFGDNFTLIGSWLVNDQAAGISVREDKNRITQDMSRYMPHIIL